MVLKARKVSQTQLKPTGFLNKNNRNKVCTVLYKNLPIRQVSWKWEVTKIFENQKIDKWKTVEHPGLLPDRHKLCNILVYPKPHKAHEEPSYWSRNFCFCNRPPTSPHSLTPNLLLRKQYYILIFTRTSSDYPRNDWFQYPAHNWQRSLLTYFKLNYK